MRGGHTRSTRSCAVSAEGKVPCPQKAIGGEGKSPQDTTNGEQRLDPHLGSPIHHVAHIPSYMPLIPLAPAATCFPSCRAALRIRWDQTWDNTNEVVFAAGSSCKEMRSQSFQAEGNKMLLNSGQAGEERRDRAETRLMQLLCPKVWIYSA